MIAMYDCLLKSKERIPYHTLNYLPPSSPLNAVLHIELGIVLLMYLLMINTASQADAEWGMFQFFPS